MPQSVAQRQTLESLDRQIKPAARVVSHEPDFVMSGRQGDIRGNWRLRAGIGKARKAIDHVKFQIAIKRQDEVIDPRGIRDEIEDSTGGISIPRRVASRVGVPYRTRNGRVERQIADFRHALLQRQIHLCVLTQLQIDACVRKARLARYRPWARQWATTV